MARVNHGYALFWAILQAFWHYRRRNVKKPRLAKRLAKPILRPT